MPALHFSVDGKQFEIRAFPKRWRHDNNLISLPQFSSNTNPKWPVIVEFFISFKIAWTETFKAFSH